MTTEHNGSKSHKAAWIGFAATIVAALIGGVVTFVVNMGKGPDKPSPSIVAVDTATPSAAAKSTETPKASPSATGISGTTLSSTGPLELKLNVESRYSEAYYAKVSRVVVQGELISVAFESFGKSNLNAPHGSCLRYSNGGDIHAKDTDLVVNKKDHYKGTLYFDSAGPGVYTFNYSCSEEYSDALVLEL